MAQKRKGKISKAPNSKKPKVELPKLNENQPVLYIECCRSCTSFKRRAEALHQELNSLLKSDLQLAINANGPPRRGSFEVSIAAVPSENVQDCKLIWTGLKNTPRAAKFPVAENILEDLKPFLKSSPEEIDAKADKESVDSLTKEVASTSKKSKRGKKK